MKQNKILALVFKTAVSVGLLYLVLSLTPIERLAPVLASTAIHLVLLSLSVALVTHYFGSIQMHAVIQQGDNQQWIGLGRTPALAVQALRAFQNTP